MDGDFEGIIWNNFKTKESSLVTCCYRPLFELYSNFHRLRVRSLFDNSMDSLASRSFFVRFVLRRNRFQLRASINHVQLPSSINTPPDRGIIKWRKKMEQRRIDGEGSKKKERERERHPCLRVPAREIVPFRILFFWGRRIVSEFNLQFLCDC